MQSQLSCSLNCHAIKTVMDSRLSCTQACHAIKTVMDSKLSCTQACHAFNTFTHPILSCNQDYRALKTIMHSRLLCSFDCLALKNVMQSDLSWTQACHACPSVMQSCNPDCYAVKTFMLSSFQSIQLHSHLNLLFYFNFRKHFQKRQLLLYNHDCQYCHVHVHVHLVWHVITFHILFLRITIISSLKDIPISLL